MLRFGDDLLLKILFVVSFTLVPSTMPLFFSSISNSLFWIRIDIGLLDPDPNWEFGFQTGFRRTKRPTKKWRICIFWSARSSVLMAAGFSCSLDVILEGPGINIKLILPKNMIFSTWKILQFFHQIPKSGSALTLNAGSGSAWKTVWIHNSGFRFYLSFPKRRCQGRGRKPRLLYRDLLLYVFSKYFKVCNFKMQTTKLPPLPQVTANLSSKEAILSGLQRALDKQQVQ